MKNAELQVIQIIMLLNALCSSAHPTEQSPKHSIGVNDYGTIQYFYQVGRVSKFGMQHRSAMFARIGNKDGGGGVNPEYLSLISARIESGLWKFKNEIELSALVLADTSQQESYQGRSSVVKIEREPFGWNRIEFRLALKHQMSFSEAIFLTPKIEYLRVYGDLKRIKAFVDIYPKLVLELGCFF